MTAGEQLLLGCPSPFQVLSSCGLAPQSFCNWLMLTMHMLLCCTFSAPSSVTSHPCTAVDGAGCQLVHGTGSLPGSSPCVQCRAAEL